MNTEPKAEPIIIVTVINYADGHEHNFPANATPRYALSKYASDLDGLAALYHDGPWSSMVLVVQPPRGATP